jgi:hypothetical protein
MLTFYLDKVSKSSLELQLKYFLLFISGYLSKKDNIRYFTTLIMRVLR